MARPKSTRPRARILFTVKGWPEWGEWVERLKLHTSHPSVASLIASALIFYARRSKFPEPAPRRWDHGTGKGTPTDKLA